MAKFVYGLNQSLDGYVDHMNLGPPAPPVSSTLCVPLKLVFAGWHDSQA